MKNAECLYDGRLAAPDNVDLGAMLLAPISLGLRRSAWKEAA